MPKHFVLFAALIACFAQPLASSAQHNNSSCFYSGHEAPAVRGDRLAPYAIKCVAPEFPSRARNSNGWVLVEFSVEADGKPSNVKSLEWSEHAFRNPAVRSVKRWRFAPATRNGEPIAVHGLTMKVTFGYELETY